MREGVFVPDLTRSGVRVRGLGLVWTSGPTRSDRDQHQTRSRTRHRNLTRLVSYVLLTSLLSRKCLLPPGMAKANDDGACLRLAHAQVENEIPARPRRAPRRGAREYRRLRAFPIWGIHIQTKSTFICGFNGVGGGGGGG